MEVRVRYAPSPTGYQHIGGLRTALFNYLFAKSSNGKFILRIEDTDRSRFMQDAMDDLLSSLDWLDIKWDEGPDIGGEFGPYIQSERKSIYQEHVQQLIDKGQAYYCFCTAERLEKLRNEQKAAKSKVQGYDRHCRDLDKDTVQQKLAAGESAVVRFKIPLEGKTEFQDSLLGKVKRKNEDINPDPVILKTDGFPTYHLANIVDDHLMRISHVLRAQEWLSSGPLHILLYRAFGWQPPIFCHLPMVMGKDGQKLSKRHGATSVREFKKTGYLPEAILNYISLLGWSLDDKTEFLSKSELEKYFSLERLNKAPAVFDYKKLDWFNGNYIRQKTEADLKQTLVPFLQAEELLSNPLTEEEEKIMDGLVPLVRERLKKLGDISQMAAFLFKDITHWNSEDLIPKKTTAEEAVKALEYCRKIVAQMDNLNDEDLEEQLVQGAETLDMKPAQVLQPLRVAVTGTKASPPLVPSMRLAGKEKSLERIEKVINLLNKN